jgi:23S rRNA (cytidine1920-2'-O)/16S rRNA (cytidine1409-2'-O)-methyltransferase
MTHSAKSVGRQRIDELLVERGLADSREKARALVLSGAVLVDGRKIDKAGHPVSQEARVEVTARLPYVSRGGVKLAHALNYFRIDVQGSICLDIGASTGGFTDCLLQAGAGRVYAVDTGAGQIDWRLRNDPRVILRERLNARYLEPSHIGEPVDLAVCDVSFISVTLVLPRIVPLMRETGEMVILIKPQFEVGRGHVGKGGVVRDPELHRAACDRVQEAVQAMGLSAALTESPITGAEGNREFLLHARR